MAGALGAPAIFSCGWHLRTPRGTHRPLLSFDPGGVKQVSAAPRRQRYYTCAPVLCQSLTGSLNRTLTSKRKKENRCLSRQCGLVEKQFISLCHASWGANAL